MNFRTTASRALLLGSAVLFAAACGEDHQQLPTETESPIEQVGSPNGDVTTALAVKARLTPGLMKKQGVVGTGLAIGDDGPTIRVYTVNGNVRGLPDHVENVPIERVVTGLIMAGDINNPTTRERPAPNGFSIGHPAITAGTLGALVRNTSDDVCHALSNNHVLANSNDADIGDSALQPGPFDGGSDPADAIGTLSDFQEISFDSDNVMDAAIAEFFDAADALGATPSYAYGTPGTSPTSASVGLNVQKFGRTTGHTTGQVAEIDVTVSVCYVARGPFCQSAATFVNQFTIEPGTFSAGGDSGSLIVTDNSSANPVGLLFAGSDTRTIANPIGPVLNRFDAVIETDPSACSNGDGEPPANNPPTADFSFSTSDLTADFTDQSSDSDGSIVSWSWDFGDGDGSTAQNPSHTYAAGGTYAVTLTVTDDDGASDSFSDDVSVSESTANEPPTADFTFSVNDLQVSFTDESTDDSGIASWSWDFGDGDGSTAQNPSHTYAAGGTYTVTLTVEDADGASDSFSDDVSVTEPPSGGDISISLDAYKVRGQHTVDVSWSGASSGVDIYRDAGTIATDVPGSSGTFTDNIGNRGPGSYTYQVCEAGDTSTCSSEATASF